MRWSAFSVMVGTLILSLALTNRVLGADDFIVQSWEGVVADTLLLKTAPANGVVEDEAAFKKVWEAWKGKTVKTPAVNFKDNRVYIYTQLNTKHLIGHFLSNGGQFRFVIVQGRDEPKPIKGFHYQMVVARRGQVKSFNPEPMVANLKK